jgi:hypothetical protein
MPKKYSKSEQYGPEDRGNTELYSIQHHIPDGKILPSHHCQNFEYNVLNVRHITILRTILNI